nr:MAG TPA: hypothetical protein [Caudoviricetes sp.]
MASTSIMSIMSWSSSASFSERWRQPGGPYTVPSRVTVHRGRMSRMASSTLAWYMRRTISRSMSSEWFPVRPWRLSGSISVCL